MINNNSIPSVIDSDLSNVTSNKSENSVHDTEESEDLKSISNKSSVIKHKADLTEKQSSQTNSQSAQENDIDQKIQHAKDTIIELSEGTNWSKEEKKSKEGNGNEGIIKEEENSGSEEKSMEVEDNPKPEEYDEHSSFDKNALSKLELASLNRELMTHSYFFLFEANIKRKCISK